MTECRFCRNKISKEDAVCMNCGYDPKIDAINPQIRQQIEAEKRLKRASSGGSGEKGKVGRGVKKFAIIGFVIIVFSIFYKYNFDISTIVFDLTTIIEKVLPIQSSKKAKEEEQKNMVFIDAGSFRKKKSSNDRNLLVEGIFYDPSNKNFVVINGKVISEGESLSCVTVKKIEENSVELLVSGETKVVRANQSISCVK